MELDDEELAGQHGRLDPADAGRSRPGGIRAKYARLVSSAHYGCVQ